MNSASEIAQALKPLQLDDKLTPQSEWTMEANPSSLQLQDLREYQDLGVNRVSLGIQSLQDHHLKLLGRAHDQSCALETLERVLKAGFNNVSVDLMCGIPGLTEKELFHSIHTLCSFPISHISIYLLTLPPHHPMAKDLPNEEQQLNQLLLIHDVLSQQGFEHYEISNFCRPGKMSRHNRSYWTGQPYLGLGPSAHSHYIDTEKQQWRWKNVSSLKQYCSILDQDQLPRQDLEALNSQQVNLEKWMLRLRLNEGFPKTWLKTDWQQRKAELFLKKTITRRTSSSASTLEINSERLLLCQIKWF